MNGVNLPLYNAGSGTTEIGVGSITASVTSKGSVFMRNNSRVQGSLVTGGSLTKQAGATVTGTTTQNASLPPPLATTWTVPLLSSPSLPQTVPYHETGALAPGSYGKLTVQSHGTMTLSPGVYAFSDLQLEWDSKLRLELDPAKGPVMIYIDAFSAFQGSVIGVNGDPAESLLLVYRGTSTARMERMAPMALVAPSANVELATGGVTHRGSFYAKGLSLDPDVKMVHVPFKYWDWREPVTPTVSCVLPAGRGKYAVAFGYENPSLAVLSVPLGSSNELTPGPVSPNPPTTLLPGAHDRAFWAPMTGETLSWSLFGKTATATRTSPRCEFGEVPDQTDEPQVYSEGRPYPRANVPPVPAPNKARLILSNAIGGGRFGGIRSTSAAQQAAPSGVGDPILLPAEEGVPPEIPEGIVSTVNEEVRVDFSITTSLPGDNFGESNDLRLWGIVGGVQDEEEVSVPLLPSGLYGYSRSMFVPSGAPYPIEFREVEYNNFSSSEVFWLRLLLDPATGVFTGHQESGRFVVKFSGVPPLPSGVDYEIEDTAPANGQSGQEFSFPFAGGNQAFWTLTTAPPPVSGSDRVEVCANWTGYFVDEALPSSDGVMEHFTGVAPHVI